MEVRGQLDAPVALPRGKSPRYPLDRRLGETRSRSGRGDELEENLSLQRNRTTVFQTVT
jgi:hypothetical protein